MRKFFTLILFSCLLINGCGPSFNTAIKRQLAFIPYTDDVEYEAKAEDYPIDLYFGDEKPTRKYEIIGEINGFIEDPENIKPGLKTRARQIGGDGVIDIKISMDTRTQTKTFQQKAWGTDAMTGMPISVPTSTLVKSYNVPIQTINAKIIRYKE